MSDGYGMHGGSGRRPNGFDIDPHEDRPSSSPHGTPVTLLRLNDNLGISYQQVYVADPPGGIFQEPLDESTSVPGFNDEPRSHRSSTDVRYHSEEVRLLSFQDRWLDDYFVRPEDLARNGFIHVGPRDKVKCVFCLNSLKDWEPNDSVEGEHWNHYPDCPFINGKCEHLNIPINPTENMERSFGLTMKPSDQRSAQPALKMHDYSERLHSFLSWPKSAPVLPSALAEAGLYYTGSGDKVVCFECKNTIADWQPGDDPWAEHAKWYPDCPYVFLVKGSRYIQQVQESAKEKEKGAEPMDVTRESDDGKLDDSKLDDSKPDDSKSHLNGAHYIPASSALPTQVQPAKATSTAKVTSPAKVTSMAKVTSSSKVTSATAVTSAAKLPSSHKGFSVAKASSGAKVSSTHRTMHRASVSSVGTVSSLPEEESPPVEEGTPPVQISSSQIDEDMNTAPVKAIALMYDVPTEEMRQVLKKIRITRGVDHKISRDDFKDVMDSFYH